MIRVLGIALDPDQILVIGQMVLEVKETETKRKKEIEKESVAAILPIKVLIEMQWIKNQVKTLFKIRMLTKQCKMMRRRRRGWSGLKRGRKKKLKGLLLKQ
jgi:hypothetical protein